MGRRPNQPSDYEKLMAQANNTGTKPTEVPSNKVEPRVSNTMSAIPKTRDFVPIPNGRSTLANKKTGKRTPMSTASATKMANKYPQIYEVK